jgi:hypothetical protein
MSLRRRGSRSRRDHRVGDVSAGKRGDRATVHRDDGARRLRGGRGDDRPRLHRRRHRHTGVDRADSFHEWIGRWDAAFESWRIEDLEVRSIDEDCTLSLFRIYAKGTGSGIELARDEAAIAKFRDGKIVRIAYYNNQAQALEAAGISG